MTPGLLQSAQNMVAGLLDLGRTRFELFSVELREELARLAVTLIGGMAVLILFAAAYLAEVVRGGLQAIPQTQYEAADALGLTYWQRTRSVVLPQALRIAVPPLVGTFIGFFKNTSLVVVIGLFDFLSSVKLSLNEPAWSGFGVEAYLFAALVYFAFCYPLSLYSRRLERRL